MQNQNQLYKSFSGYPGLGKILALIRNHSKGQLYQAMAVEGLLYQRLKPCFLARVEEVLLERKLF
jgi:hypothetical protein